MTGYAFGDSDLAARRLALVASVFASATRAFVAQSLLSRPGVAIDVGCGPGHSTELLAETTRGERVIGLDTSQAYVALAERRRPDLEFAVHDVTALPLPGAPADVIFCRLLLAHLPDPVAIASAWLTQLRPGGLLLLDEVEFIETAHPVLAFYEEVVVGLVGANGGPMYAGPKLAGLDAGEAAVVRSDDVRVVPVPTADAARMYGMNLRVWRDDPWVREHFDAARIDRLAADLEALASAAAGSDISWGLRQVALERR